MCVQMRKQGDAKAKVASANNKYTVRLKKIMGKHTSVNGTPLNYKVYITDDINANASADGSVRVYSGLMDLMNDDELRFVLGHEIGHVALGHTLKAMRLAYTAAAARQAAGSLNSTANALSDSMLGDLMEEVLHNKYYTAAAASSLRKLEALGSSGGFLSSHPISGKRAEKMEELAAQK